MIALSDLPKAYTDAYSLNDALNLTDLKYRCADRPVLLDCVAKVVLVKLRDPEEVVVAGAAPGYLSGSLGERVDEVAAADDAVVVAGLKVRSSTGSSGANRFSGVRGRRVPFSPGSIGTNATPSSSNGAGTFEYRRGSISGF